MNKKALALTVAGALALSSLTACGNNPRQGAGTTTNQVKTQNVRPFNTAAQRMDQNRWDNRRGTNYTSMHNNTRMEMSKDIADRIAAMREVDSAYVLLTDKNAYVAVALKNRNKNAGANAANIGADMKGAATGLKRTGQNLLPKTGMTGRTAPGTPAAPGPATPGGVLNGTANGTDVQVTDALKDRIANVVQSMHPVNNVYVSANPGFVDRLSGFSQQFRNGKPIRGMILEFNNMVQRLFPDQAGTNRTNAPNMMKGNVPAGNTGK